MENLGHFAYAGNRLHLDQRCGARYSALRVASGGNARAVAGEFGPQEASHAAWALALLRSTDAELLGPLATRATGQDTLTCVAWCYATLEAPHSA